MKQPGTESAIANSLAKISEVDRVLLETKIKSEQIVNLQRNVACLEKAMNEIIIN